MDGEPEFLSEANTFGNVSNGSDSMVNVEQAKLESLEKKAVHLRLMLEKDFKAADMKWSLFVAAAFSFRYESCLKPFPPVFLKEGTKDMDALLSLITDVPALDLMIQQLDNLENLAHISDVIDLLFYILVKWKEPLLKTVPLEGHENVLLNARIDANSSIKPQFIFQVVHSSKSAAEAKWKDLAKNHNVFYAFHGNRLENFYRILNFGFQSNFVKFFQIVSHCMPAAIKWYHLNGALVSPPPLPPIHIQVPNAFRKTLRINYRMTSMLQNCQTPGVCLTPELSASLPSSHSGFGWGASCIGGHLSCVAMVEVIDCPNEICYQHRINNEGDGLLEDGKKEKKAQGDEPPENYAHYIINNTDLMRLRYLLVYAKQPNSSRLPPGSGRGNAGGIRQWFARHKLFSILLGYGIMLATIGFANNQPINHYYKTFLTKLDGAYSNMKI